MYLFILVQSESRKKGGTRDSIYIFPQKVVLSALYSYHIFHNVIDGVIYYIAIPKAKTS